MIDGVAKLGGEARAEAKAPAELRQAEAMADKTTAEAQTAAVTAENAPAMKAAELQKMAADLGLTKAQTNQAMALTRKYNAEIQQAAIQAQTGDPAKKFDFETKLRGEYVKQIAPVVETQQAYERVKASQDTAVGDLSLIFGYMKMLDPGSVVREGEFATAQNAAGVDDKVRNVYNRLVSGERLTPGQRSSFKSQAKDLYGVSEKRAEDVRKSLDPVIKSYSLDSRNIFGEQAQQNPAPAPTPPAAGEPTATNPKTGQKLVLRGGKWVPL